MVYIIAIIVILGLIGALIEFIGEHKKPVLITLGCVVVLVVAYRALGWLGIFILFGVIVILGILVFIASNIYAHDESKKETAKINQETQAANRAQMNENELILELNKNCYHLGLMTPEKWKKKLPNYVGRSYMTSFESITFNFAKQIEQGHIVQNDDWFEPFKIYILNHPSGATVTKMLNEVVCPQLKMTHVTPDGDLVNTWLVRGTKRVSKDVPELFKMTFIKEMNEYLFTPSEYLKHLYEKTSPEVKGNESVEIDFNEL